jgi:hypothetical protein
VKRLAIFVEGQTEKIFVRKLLEEIAGKNNIAIEDRDLKLGNKVSRITELRMIDRVTDLTKYYVLIYNSGTDNRVGSDIREQYNSLVSSGYEKIIGLRDLFPDFTIDQKNEARRGLQYALPKGTIPAHIVLAIMEVEAWFLAEWNHFLKVDARLTTDLIKENLGFDPAIDDMEARSHPAEDLHHIYQLVGRAYRKQKNQVDTVVTNLDYEFLYLKLVSIVPSLGEFIGYIDEFMIT